MGKVKTSTKRKESLKSTTRKRTLRTDLGITKCNPTQELLNEDLIALAVWECLKDNDPDGVIEIIQIHLKARNKSQISKEAEISRSTMYNSLKSKNPQLRTLAKIIHGTTSS